MPTKDPDSSPAYHPKLDPRLSALLELTDAELEGDAAPDSLESAPYEPEGVRRRGLRAFVERASSLESYPASGAEAEKAQAFIVFSRDVASLPGLDRFARLGIEVRSRAGDIVTARVPLGALAALEADPDVRWVEIARPLHPQADASPVAATAGDLGRDAARGLDGAGTLIGVVDVGGLDIYHPAFRNLPAQRTRVEGIWDQQAEPSPGARGRAPEEWGYGVEVTHEDVQTELEARDRRRYEIVRHAPVKGAHGTAVAGLAAGGGEDEPRAAGIAPAARILYVDTVGSGTEPLGSTIELAEAVDYVFRRAGETPCSVNVSLGDDLGPHDGTSPVERFFDGLLAVPGRCICIAAGNSGRARKHQRGELAPGQTAEITIRVDPTEREPAAIEIWYDGAADVDVVVEAASESTPAAKPGSGPTASLLGGTRAIVTSNEVHPLNDKKRIRVELLPAALGGAFEGGEHRIRLTARTAACVWNAWVDHRFMRFERPTDSMTVASPGTCRSAVTVGACAPSGGGPLSVTARGDGEKPDFSAPGTALSASGATTVRYAELTGTSVAAPQVAGVVALLFQAFAARGRLLSAAEVKRLLREMASSSDSDGGGRDPEGGAHDPALGWGRVDIGRARRALEDIEGLSRVLDSWLF